MARHLPRTQFSSLIRSNFFHHNYKRLIQARPTPSHLTVFTQISTLFGERRNLSNKVHSSKFLGENRDDPNLSVGHSRFLAEAPPYTKWEHAGLGSINSENLDDLSKDEFDDVADGKGKILPTSSHLFKLIVPLGDLSHPRNNSIKPKTPGGVKPSRSTVPPTVILLHSSQPLSHVSRLIAMSLAPATPIISFRSSSRGGQAFQWSDSTDVGDFIRDAARSSKFSICITYEPSEHLKQLLVRKESSHRVPVNSDFSTEGVNGPHGAVETVIDVQVPTFRDRTRYLRRKGSSIEHRLYRMELLKKECDVEAHRGARRMARTGFGMLIVYWATVARLTFWDYGWDIMEPITYLSGLSTVIMGYLWFLYQGREVSYSSVLAQSISRRRDVLYRSKGLDIAKYEELGNDRRALNREISRIAEDYEDRIPRDASRDDNAKGQVAHDGVENGLTQAKDQPGTVKINYDRD